MYNMNYIDGIVTKEKYGSAFVRFLKILNFFVHIGIIAILVFSVMTYLEIGYYNTKITETKKEIEEKRVVNRIPEIEQEWETLYYKLLAVKAQLEQHTSYGFVFRDLGLYMPAENAILELSFKEASYLVDLTMNEGTLKGLTSFYDYAPTLNTAFEKSTYLGHNVIIQSLTEKKLDNKLVVKDLRASIEPESTKISGVVEENGEEEESEE